MASNLSSDHLNYLVWRYLQECGYAHTAVQLQRDWAHADPQALPFAHAVKPLALRSLVQDGLFYDTLRASIQKPPSVASPSPTGSPDVANSHATLGRRYAFVDIKKRAVSERIDDGSRPSSSSADGPRKRARVGTNGIRTTLPLQPRRRLPRDTSLQDESMDVDSRSPQPDFGTGDATPVVEEPPPPLPTTLEIGESTGMQSEPVVDRTIATVVADTSIPGAEVVHLHWHPADPLQLEASGFCAWRAYTFASSAVERDIASPEFQSLSPLGVKSFYVTARAHAPSTADTPPKSAAALEEEAADDSSAAIYLTSGYSTTHTKSDLLLSLDSQTLFLHFSPDAARLLGVISFSDGSWIVNIWHAASAERSPTTLHLTDQDISAAAWLGPSAFALCGKDVLDLYSVSGDSITLLKSVTANREWEMLAFDSATRAIACASPEDGYLGLLSLPADYASIPAPSDDTTMTSADDSATDAYVFSATKVHDAEITRIAWHPLRANATPTHPQLKQRLLATAANDGSVKLWDTLEKLDCIWSFSMAAGVPAMALAFSPLPPSPSSDFEPESPGTGLLLAAAGGREIKIWKAEKHGQVVAHWEGTDADADADTAVVDEDPSESPIHQLEWNCEGKCLAYSQGERMTVIELPA